VAIAPTSKSAAAPAALIESAQMSIVELRESDPKLVPLVREAEDSEVERGMVAAGGGRKGKRAEYRCAACGYGIVVYGRPPGCPMCSEGRWEHVGWRPSAVREPVAT
jgi:rubrerythrin